jgi:hypothetical protein
VAFKPIEGSSPLKGAHLFRHDSRSEYEMKHVPLFNIRWARIEQSQALGSNQAIGFGDEWRRNDQDVATAQHAVQLIGAGNPIGEWRLRLIHAPADAIHAHPKSMRAPCHLLSGGTEPDNCHCPSAYAPGPYIARQFILNPAAFTLSVQHQVEAARKHKQAANDEFRHRCGLNATRIGNHDIPDRKVP